MILIGLILSAAVEHRHSAQLVIKSKLIMLTNNWSKLSGLKWVMMMMEWYQVEYAEDGWNSLKRSQYVNLASATNEMHKMLKFCAMKWHASWTCIRPTPLFSVATPLAWDSCRIPRWLKSSSNDPGGQYPRILQGSQNSSLCSSSSSACWSISNISASLAENFSNNCGNYAEDRLRIPRKESWRMPYPSRSKNVDQSSWIFEKLWESARHQLTIQKNLLEIPIRKAEMQPRSSKNPARGSSRAAIPKNPIQGLIENPVVAPG